VSHDTRNIQWPMTFDTPQRKNHSVRYVDILPKEVRSNQRHLSLKLLNYFLNEKRTYSKTIYEVIETPRDDNIVVNGNEESNDARRNANATEPGMDSCPYAESTQSHSLAHAEFNEKQRNSFKHQHHHEWNQKSSCGKFKNKFIRNAFLPTLVREHICL
jgi:hypothetical protein